MQVTTVGEQIRQMLLSLSDTANPELAGQTLVAVPLLRRLHAGRDYQPAWPPGRWQELLEVLRAGSVDGLSTRDYHKDAMQRAEGAERAAGMPAKRQVEFDLLFTGGLLRLVDRLESGKVAPAGLVTDWRPQPVIDDQALEFKDTDLAGGLAPYPATSALGPFVHIDARDYRARWEAPGIVKFRFSPRV